MPIFPECDFPVLSNEATIATIREAVRERQPFSLLRLGDGEGVVLAFDDNMWLGDLAYLHEHWGSDGISLGDIADVQRDLRTAMAGADVVGIREDLMNVSLPSDLLERAGRDVKEFAKSAFRLREDERDSISRVGARRLVMLHRELSHFDWSEATRFCSAWIHWELLASGELDRILEGIPEVGLVTARPELEALVARRFGVRTKAVLVPEKYVEAPGSGRHVPDRYRRIRSEFTFPEGTLVLVGAGIPGKVYCQWLKGAGCVAVDVGSVFDAWVGKASRPRVLESRFNVPGGGSVPVDVQLRLPVSAEHRRLTPRWKASGLSA